jgi:SM-20-related protein
MQVRDDFLDADFHARIDKFLRSGGWRFGWKSNSQEDCYAFWHKHFAGYRRQKGGARTKRYPCAEELRSNAATVFALWEHLAGTVLRGHTLYRCYANAQTYGSDGTLHTDKNGWTSLYYPHAAWEPNYAGETVFFNEQGDDTIASIYPKPNRLVIFPGMTPHLARGVSRTCPLLRITLAFKTEGPEPPEPSDDDDDPGAIQELSAGPGADERTPP